jgi:hypothetical protein
MHLPMERNRLLQSLIDILPVPGITLCTAVISESDFPDLGDLVFPVEAGGEIHFMTCRSADAAQINICTAKNSGIRRLIARGCQGVVCLDVDYLVPPGLLELLVYPAVQPFHVWVRRRDIQPEDAPARAWADWLKRPIFSEGGECRGSCNYMSAENWLKAGGWDERAGVGWGGDDDVLHWRVREKGIRTMRFDSIPLSHVAHGRRPWALTGQYRGADNAAWMKVPQPNYLGEAHP